MSQAVASNNDCAICSAPGPETFRYMGKRYIFDIDKAREIIGDGREPVELDEDDTRFSLYKCHINREHTKHVDTSIPGIIAIVPWTDENGEYVTGHRLIDGHHRAARCLDLGIPYRAYLLTEQETNSILIKRPGSSIR